MEAFVWHSYCVLDLAAIAALIGPRGLDRMANQKTPLMWLKRLLLLIDWPFTPHACMSFTPLHRAVP